MRQTSGSDESLGILHDLKVQKEARTKENAAKLDNMVAESAKKMNIPTNGTAIFDAARQRFTIDIDSNKLKPLSSYQTIEHFLLDYYAGNVFSTSAPMAQADINIRSRQDAKAAKYQELILHANNGDMKAYRRARAEYSAL